MKRHGFVLLALLSAVRVDAEPGFLSASQLESSVLAVAGRVRAEREAKRQEDSLIEGLFAFAVQQGGYGEFCRQQGCRASAVIRVEPSEYVRKDHNGWYNNGNSYIKARPSSIGEEITTVHELTHHLQRLSNRYHQYRGPCNQYLAEKEAYEVGEAYARGKGYMTKPEARIAAYEKRCRDAVDAGLVKLPEAMARR
ncbi:MAG: hypothetical protein AAB320_10150 [Elusimicrobiota bacterium]